MSYAWLKQREAARRLMSVAVAALLAISTLVLVAPAEAHLKSVQADCDGWSVELAIYDPNGPNSAQIWTDGTQIVDIADFGTDYTQAQTWDPYTNHTLRVKVLAHDDLDGSRGLSFDWTLTTEDCVGPPTLKLVKTVSGGSATADDWALSAAAPSPDDDKNFSNLGGSGTFHIVNEDVIYSLAESGGPADYTAGSWSCTVGQSAPIAGSTISLQNGEAAVCTITNTYAPTPAPAIEIEKATNGEDADDPTGPQIAVGDPVTWTYIVTNTGNVDLTDVAVTDDVLGDICTIGDLAAGASDTCTAEGTAALGQYANLGTATGWYSASEEKVTDTDPSHYVGVQAAAPAIEVTKSVDPAIIPEGTATTVTWSITVTNPGPVPLHGVYLTDAAVPDCDLSIGDLAVGESTPPQTCSSTHTPDSPSWSFTNVAEATGFGPDGTSVSASASAAIAPISVAGTAELGDTVWYDSNKNGVQDAGESGINGAQVMLKDSTGTVFATATTAKGPWDGWYKFVGLEAGTYTATINMSSVKSTYKLTTAGSFTVALEEGQEYVDADFGLYEPEQLPVTGMNSGALALLGMALVLIGAVAVRFGQRIRGEG